MSDIQQRFVNQRYHANRMNGISSINSHEDHSSQEPSADISIIEAVFSGLGIKKFSPDLGQWIDSIMMQSPMRIFSFGLSTLPTVTSNISDPSSLGILKYTDPGGLGDYVHLKAGLYSSASARRR